MNRKHHLSAIFALIAIDIVIKLIIDHYFMETKFIFGNLIGFTPYLNTTQLSIFNNELALGVSTGALIALNLLLIPVIPITYRWLNKDQELGQSIHISEDLLLAGTVCSLLDKVFWSGSLDYLFFLNLWIIDLKDIYLFGAVVLVFYCGIKYEIDQHKS